MTTPELYLAFFYALSLTIVVCARDEQHRKTLVAFRYDPLNMLWPPFLRYLKATHFAYIDETLLP